MQLLKLLSDERQHFAAGCSQSVILSRASATRVLAARKPAVTRHPIQQWVKGAGADLISMPAQFRGDPLTMNRLLARMMQNMHLPEGEQNFAGFGFHIVTITDIGYRLLPSGCQSPIREQWSTRNESKIQLAQAG